MGAAAGTAEGTRAAVGTAASDRNWRGAATRPGEKKKEGWGGVK
jgi:hypothetical protein